MNSTRTKVLASLALTATLMLGCASLATGARPDVTVGTTPASYTPWLLASTPNQNVQQLVPCGDTMYAVGTISAIGQGGYTYARGNAFSFSATTGAVTPWDPQVNGHVNSIALSADCTTAYLGGSFTSVHGTAAKNIAAVDTTGGSVRSAFAHTADLAVSTLVITHGIVLAGGAFTSINGVARSHLASLDPVTGAPTTYANLTVTGSYPNATTRVFNSQLSHSGAKLLIEGVFTALGGQARQQVAILDLGASSATVNGWTSTEFTRACIPTQSFYVQSANWSPDDSTVYVATTGERPASGAGSGPSDPRDGLCAAVAAFPATSGSVSHTWLNYSGCDSYYAVASDASNVYVGGHERWANNPTACDYQGSGAVARPGIGSVSPSTGLATGWNPTRSRGHGVTDLLVTAAGLWVASDNFTRGAAQMCGHVGRKGGICFLKY